MSDLRIGQRCRLVGMKDVPNEDWRGCEGDEVTILGLPGCDSTFPEQYRISMPQHATEAMRGFRHYAAPRENLRPLTDPGADAFIERIRKLGREPINLAEKVTR